jgi:DNA-3-methyladenine glycosylase
LGKRLVCGKHSGVIVETEAYLGPEDKASHARFGDKGRSAPMFGAAGISYVYLCYGIHHLFNVVTGKKGRAEAVLVRALAFADSDVAKGAGPGKFTRVMQITREEHNGLDLVTSKELAITKGPHKVDKGTIASGPRIGVDYAGSWASRPLRYWLKDHPSVSK